MSDMREPYFSHPMDTGSETVCMARGAMEGVKITWRNEWQHDHVLGIARSIDVEERSLRLSLNQFHRDKVCRRILGLWDRYESALDVFKRT